LIPEFFSGDSGSGMILKVDNRLTLIGIVSAAVIEKTIIYGQRQSVCDLNNYVIYTDVSKYYDWVYQVVLKTI
jgi:secreted trypsin-like serine protease